MAEFPNRERTTASKARRIPWQRPKQTNVPIHHARARLCRAVSIAVPNAPRWKKSRISTADAIIRRAKEKRTSWMSDKMTVRKQNMRPPEATMRKQTDAPLFPFSVEDRGLSFFLAFLVLITIFVPMFRLFRPWRIGMGPNFRVDALLGRYRDYSPESLCVSDRRADCPGVHSGLDRRIQPIARPLGLGYGTEGIWPGHSGGHDAEAHFSSGPR